MPISLAVIMFGMGITLRIQDFRQVVQIPKAFIIGSFNQMVLVPILALSICFILNLDPILSLGLMLIAACPGGPATNLITFLANGNIALSISLTSVDALLTAFTLPLILSVSIQYFLKDTGDINLPILQTIGKIYLMTVIPVSLGMLLKYKKPAIALIIRKYIKPLSASMYLLILLSILISSFDLIIDSFKDLGVASIMLNIGGMLSGWLLATIFGLNVKDRIAIIIESSIQNGSLAIVIASSILLMPKLALIAGVYSLIMFASSGIVILLANKMSKF